MTAAAELVDDQRAHHPHDNIVVLHGATWADYQRLLEIRGDRSAPRISYLEGSLEIMSPSQPHESINSTIGRLVEAWCEHHGIDFSPYGSWTLEKKELERGAEPDECYVFGADEGASRPDLAIEVVWSSGGIDKLAIYRKLGVGEVWFWRGGKLRVFVLRGEQYEETNASEILAGIDLPELTGFIERKPTSRAIREYRAALRARR